MTYSVFLSPEDNIIGWAACLFLFAPITIFVLRDAQVPRKAVIASLVVRIVYMIYNTYFSTLLVDPFEELAASASALGWNAVWLEFGPNSQLYLFFCSILYLLIGRNPIALQGINISLSVWTVILVALIARRFGGFRAGRMAAWLVGMMPSSVIFSTVILREAVVVFPMILGVYVWLVYLRRNTPFSSAVALVCFTASFAFHYGCIALLVAWAAIFTYKQIQQQRDALGKMAFVCVGCIVSSGVLVLLYYAGVLTALMPGSANILEISPEVVGVGLQVAARDRAAYLQDVVLSSPVDLLWQLPIRIVYFVLAPFPWMWTSMVDALGALDMMIYLSMFIIAYSTRRYWARSIEMCSVAITFAICVAMFSVGTSNYGTAIRHRAKFFPLIAVVAATGLAMRQGRLSGRLRG